MTSSAAKFLHWGSEDSDLIGVGNVYLDETTLTLNTSSLTTTGNVLHFSSTTGVAVGNFVAGTNIPTNTWVDSLTGTTVTLNQDISGPVASASPIIFSTRFDPFVSYGLGVNTPPTSPLANFWRTVGQFDTPALCVTTNMWTNCVSGFISQFRGATFLIRFLDQNGVPRLAITNPNFTVGPSGPWIVASLGIDGSVTQLGSALVGVQANVLQRLTMFYDADNGRVDVKVNGALVFRASYTPPTTFQGYDLGNATTPAGTGQTVWSSVKVANFDCDSIVMSKLYITGAGAASAWNGAADGSTVNELLMNITDGIDTATPNDVELFTTNTSLPGGSWDIVGLGIAAFASASEFGFTANTSGDTATGATIPFADTTGMFVGQRVTGPEIPAGSVILSIVVNTNITLDHDVSADLPSGSTLNFLPPQHMQVAVRIGGTNYFSETLVQNLDGSGNIVDIAPALDRVGAIFPVSPATGQAFTSAEIGSIEIGLKAIA